MRDPYELAKDILQTAEVRVRWLIWQQASMT